VENNVLPSGKFYLCFLCYDSAFTVLGKIKMRANSFLRQRVYYSIGLSSIVLMLEKKDPFYEIEKIVGGKPVAYEIWEIGEDGVIKDIEAHVEDSQFCERCSLNIVDYQGLPEVIKATVDEFAINMLLVLPKVALHMKGELKTFLCLVDLINELIVELVYLHELNDEVPESLAEYSFNDFEQSPALCKKIIHQDTDRIIQVNAALSSFSVQGLSGAVPVLERRSLLRRYSLLGIGTAVMALTKIARSIEIPFSKYPIEDIVDDRMNDAPQLSGLGQLPSYDSSKWGDYSVNRWIDRIDEKEIYAKLPYFSYRLGFRETEYSISAAVQSLVGGAGLEWSLLTITHEMMHGHVRKILACLFQGEPDKSPELKWSDFYNRFDEKMRKGQNDESLLDSLRNIIFTYCCQTITHGSITKELQGGFKIIKDTNDPVKKIKGDFFIPKHQARLWRLYECEYRNISEIFVHILDFHYFYGSRLKAFIPLVWHTWGAVPHVSADIRQYLLRSLLTIAVTKTGTPMQRFKSSMDTFVEIIHEFFDSEKDALIGDLFHFLKSNKSEKSLFLAFSASLLIVDMVNKVFFCEKIRAELFGDEKISWTREEGEMEERFDYAFSDDFVNEVINKPSAYLLHRVLKKMRTDEVEGGLESETAILMLACSSS